MKSIKILIILLFVLINTGYGQDEECIICHEDETLNTERSGKLISLFVNSEHFAESVHADLSCVDCHEGFDPDEMPHKEGENIYKVDCSSCHDVENYQESIHARKNLGCFSCHSKHEIKEVSTLKVAPADFCITCHNGADVKGYLQSVHYSKNLKDEISPACADCHGGSAHSITSAEFSENELHELCAACHEDAVVNFENSLHGEALAQGRFLAPNCITCHNSHKILSSSNENAKTYKMNIPVLCGECHKDGTKVSELKSVSQRHILEDYSESIHGDGLFRRGLIVSAVCTDCHFSHNILPHENPNSSINRNNIAGTCTQCHVQIEKVHVKVINGELWEKEPQKIPACIDCHEPHKVRRVFYEQNFTNDLCMDCHSRDNVFKTVNGERISLKIDLEEHKSSAHKDNSCIKCHTNVSAANNPVCLNSGPVDCSICHAEHVDNYNVSIHGKLRAEGHKQAPYCTDCHGVHDMLKKDNLDSPTSRRNIPKLCAECHVSGVQPKLASSTGTTEFVKSYEMSIHGKGLLESGLTVTATCIDCHTSHRELPASDPQSSVNHNNIANTCANCHSGIYEQFRKSIHSPEVSESDEILPSCADCHQSHAIERTDKADFRQGIIDQCGKCHEGVTKSYFDTFHGKVSQLGSTIVAKCQDCHGAHNILPTYMPGSKLSRENIVETCKTCHPNSNRKFVGYLTHATHHDKDKYPVLYYTFWAMTILLVGTFTFFGLHTLLWLPRALAEKKKQKRKSTNE
ncbi:MAG: hypothetical protein JW995_14485 [Melioribacteraceae bacterium]|nr:hypothetical protein [Melioribacteraceae bacterium]